MRLVALTAGALAAFAANSLLCRAALRGGAIDPASFTLVRLVSGAVMLAVLARRSAPWSKGTLASGVALFIYALAFSFAYRKLDAAAGALVLFGAVQTTMLGWGVATGERPAWRVWLGGALALSGLVALLLPGLSAPPLVFAGLMTLAGVAWAVYTLRGRGANEPLAVNAGNFARASLFALVPFGSAAMSGRLELSGRGLLLAAVSGAVTSGLGYSLWYQALPSLTRAQAAIVQLTVPPLAALGGVVLFHETLTARLVLCGAVILGGVALATRR